MIETDVTNNYLKAHLNEIEKYLNDDGEVPEELFIAFLNELNVSTLLIPGIVNDEDLDFEVLSSEDDEVNVIALFTDDEEFYRFYPEDSEYGPIANEIEFYISLIKENDLDGCMFNPGSSEFFLEKDILVELPVGIEDDEEDDGGEGYPADRIYEISQGLTNDSLLELIRSDNVSFEQLMLELSDSLLLNLIASENDLSGIAVDNIISKDDAGDFSLCATGDDDNQFGVLFTSVDAIRQSMYDDDDDHYYYQVTLLEDFMEFILLNDMDGIIINPGVDDYLISRDYLLEAYHGLKYNNPNFKNAAEYAFLL
ncbi:MAG: SseB family protein [Methanobrevibacter sp.]|nr:SseB family protein [Methanobrevibacter sp.]